MKPVLVPISASTSSATKTASATPLTGFGAKPPPRNGTGCTDALFCAALPVVVTVDCAERVPVSDIDQLLVRGRGFLAHQLPELSLFFLENRIAEMAFGKRDIDIDDVANSARAAR